RLSALIELGAGFHPELTGRENVYLYASFLGMTRKDIDRRMDEILAFSEMGEFIDSPIKAYSMGMFLRLAFSTALQVDPDILIIDEIIGVGDVSFQEKSVGRILQLKDSGKTIAVVSHHMTLIRYLSTKVLWLERGEVKGFGPPSEVIGAYLDHLKVTAIGKEEIRGPGGVTINRRRWGEGTLVLDKVALVGEDGKEKFLFAPGERMCVRCHLRAKAPVKGLGLMLQLHLQDGSNLDGPRLFLHEKPFSGEGTVDFVFDGLPFVRGTFMLSVGLYDRENAAVPCDYHERLYEFSVLDQGDIEALGFLKLPGRWETNLGD
ncbi:MAG: ABC transporter ATP-binding protein, partial [bacterium]